MLDTLVLDILFFSDWNGEKEKQGVENGTSDHFTSIFVSVALVTAETENT